MEERLRAVRMVVEEGASASVVAGVLGRSPRTINDWVKKSRRGRKPSALESRPARGAKPKLSSRDRRRLLKLLAKGPEAAGFKSPLWTGRRIAQLIEREFGVTHHPAYVPTLRRPLVVVLDNLPTHKGRRLRQWRQTIGDVHLEFLPPYAPELNPIEGVWSHGKCVTAAGRAVDDADEWSEAVDAASEERLLRGFIKGTRLSMRFDL